MTSVADLLNQLYGYVDLINESIQEKDWDRLNDLLVERQSALEALLALNVSESEKALIIIAMTSMQANDQQILVEVQSQKDELQKQLSTFVHDRKSVKAYLAE